MFNFSPQLKSKLVDYFRKQYEFELSPEQVNRFLFDLASLFEAFSVTPENSLGFRGDAPSGHAPKLEDNWR